MENPFIRNRNSYIPTSAIAQEVDKTVSYYENQRKSFERKWYDNNYFDDGYHFRYVSKTTGKVVDIGDRGSTNLPQRAIPKASRQIRGIANLLVGLEPTPTIYPEKVSTSNYPNPQYYQAALESSKMVARKTGVWLEEEWKKQHLKEKLIHMVILAAKHGVSFIEVWPDAVEEAIKTQVFDAFDIYLMGNLTSIYDSPSITKAVPQLISTIKANEYFDEEQLSKITPDNKYASSEIKQAYMQSRFGSGMEADAAATLIQKETFIKEYLNDDNWQTIVSKTDDTDIMTGKSKGDMVMRQAFSAGGIWLRDTYVDLPDYPFADFRFEPGPIYQKPIMENFIPANKSLDILVDRLEKWANTMVSGHWIKRKGESLEITNIGGGQVLEYSGTPPVQGNMTNVPSGIFSLISFLEKNIDENGAAASSFNTLPSGVKSGVAIESIKATEYANLKIASDQFKETVRTISEKMLDIADKHFVSPQSVYLLDAGEPTWFDIIGQRGIELRREAGIDVPQNIVPLKKDYQVDINIESGLGYTMEGKRETMQQIVQYFVPLIEGGLVSRDSLAVLTKQLLDTYQFGATQEFMDALNTGTQTAPLNEEQIMQMKVAMLEALKDAGYVGQEEEERQIQTTKIGVAEAINDLQGSNNPER